MLGEFHPGKVPLKADPHIRGFRGLNKEVAQRECTVFFFFLRCYLFLERGEGRERGRETSMCGCLSCAPYWGPGLRPKHVP